MSKSAKKERRDLRTKAKYWLRAIKYYLKDKGFFTNLNNNQVPIKEMATALRQIHPELPDGGRGWATLAAFVTQYPQHLGHSKIAVIPKVKRIKKVDYKAFYETREWRELRYKALKLYGLQCQCCGRKPPKVCLHVDHILPRSKYRHLELDIRNLQILCEDCNLGKSAWDITDWRTPEQKEMLERELCYENDNNPKLTEAFKATIC